jgi:hypothetical protein
MWIGNEAKGKGSKVTSHGRELALCVPLSTPALLRNKIKARNLKYKVYDLDSLKSLAEEGMKMKDVDSRGLLAWDGIHDMINGGYAVLIFATVCNGKIVIVGVSITSGETLFCVESSKSAFDSAAERLFKGEDTRSEWTKCDSGLANQRAVAAHDDKIDKAATACSVKLIKDAIPKQKNRLRDKANYDTVFRDACRLVQFPPLLIGKVWAATKASWTELGEENFASYFQDNWIDENPGWMVEKIACGITTHQNEIENNLQHQVKTPVLDAVRRVRPRARFPAPLLNVLAAFTGTVIPRWSKETLDFNWDQTYQPTPRDIRESRHFARAPNLVRLSNKVYCSRQLNEQGPLRTMSKDVGREVAEMYQMAELDPKNLSRFTTVRFTTTDSCFPCKSFGEHLFCFHVGGVCELQGVPLPGLDIPERIGGAAKRQYARSDTLLAFQSTTILEKTSTSHQTLVCKIRHVTRVSVTNPRGEDCNIRHVTRVFLFRQPS